MFDLLAAGSPGSRAGEVDRALLYIVIAVGALVGGLVALLIGVIVLIWALRLLPIPLWVISVVYWIANGTWVTGEPTNFDELFLALIIAGVLTSVGWSISD